jgi:hypothetical protein
VPDDANGLPFPASAHASGGPRPGQPAVAITNNQVRQYNADGIHLNVGSSESLVQGDVALNATVTGNTVEQPGQFGSNAFELNGGTNTGNTNAICLGLLRLNGPVAGLHRGSERHRGSANVRRSQQSRRRDGHRQREWQRGRLRGWSGLRHANALTAPAPSHARNVNCRPRATE